MYVCVMWVVSAGLTVIGLAGDWCSFSTSLHCSSLNAVLLFSCTARLAMVYIRGSCFISVPLFLFF